MQITIDTKHDSHEEIKRIIKMLSSLVGEQEVFTNQNPTVEIEQTEPQAAPAPTDSPPDLMNIFVEEQKKSDTKPIKKADDELGIPLLEEYTD